MKSFLILVVVAKISIAGVLNGGGGIGVKCSYPNGKTKVETLDLFEAELKYKTKIDVAKDSSLEDVFVTKGAAIYNYLRTPHSPGMTSEPTEAQLKEVLRDRYRNLSIKFVKKEIPFSNDATIPTLPKECKVVQLAFWKDITDPNNSGKEYLISINANLWQRLSPANKAALLTHEIFYKWAREGKAANSDETRWLIGAVFANVKLSPRFPTWWPNDIGYCVGDSPNTIDGEGTNEFVIHAFVENEKNTTGLGFYLENTYDRMPLTRTRTFVPNLKLSELVFENSNFPSVIEFKNEFNGPGWTLNFFKLNDYTRIDMTNLMPRFVKVESPIRSKPIGNNTFRRSYRSAILHCSVYCNIHDTRLWNVRWPNGRDQGCSADGK